MSIQFEEDNLASFTGVSSPAGQGGTGSKMADWLIKIGVATDASSANIIMVTGSLIAIAISFYLFIFGFSVPSFGSNSAPKLPVGAEQAPGLEN